MDVGGFIESVGRAERTNHTFRSNAQRFLETLGNLTDRQSGYRISARRLDAQPFQHIFALVEETLCQDQSRQQWDDDDHRERTLEDVHISNAYS